ncbi:lysine--tRNA ligase, partial [Candidatus Woesearchaeota archaeon]|nr:lysine--tRNA ligase [Candidatus Woesearchaeota archaeon]
FLVNPEVKEVFRKRAEIYKAIREFLDERGFLEVQTPILQPLYGGGIARPFTTNIHAWDMQMYLRIAYEIYLKKLIVGGFEKIYDLSSCFRNEGSDKTHNPEFAMMEIQWAYADYEDQIKLTEELWEYVAKKINGTTKITFGDTVIDLKAPWKRLRVVDALKELANIDVEAISEEELFALVKKHNIKVQGEINRGVAIALLFEELCEDKLIQPTHIIDHPIEICPLAKPHRDDPRYAERDEPFINAWEVGNIYTELNDPVMQREHFEEQVKQRDAGDEEAHPMDEDYIEALEHGLPPNAGNGVGIERMIMLLTENESIRDVILFPTMKPEEEKMKKENKKKSKGEE